MQPNFYKKQLKVGRAQPVENTIMVAERRNNMNNFSENLKKIRKENNLSQEDLAESLGVSRQAISKWESGIAYPEMDKIIQICSLFDVNIDDLLHKDIREVKGEVESKKNLNNHISDFLKFVSDTINLIFSMKLKTLFTFLIEEVAIVSCLMLLFYVICSILMKIFSIIFENLMSYNIYSQLYGIVVGLFTAFSLVLGIMIVIHIFKVRYLDYYRNIKVKKEEKPKEEIISIKETENKIKLNEEKIIIRDPSHSEYKFLSGIYAIIIAFIKFFALIGGLILSSLLVFFAFLFISSFLAFKSGIFFIGLFLGSLSLIILTLDIALFMFNFVFNRITNKKHLIWTFIVGIILFGISLGFIFIGSTKFKVIKDDEFYETRKVELKMSDNLLFSNLDDVSFIEKDIDSIEFEYDINRVYNLVYNTYDMRGYKVFSYYEEELSDFEYFKYILSRINNYEIIDANTYIKNIKIYASKDNIKLIKENHNKYEKEETECDANNEKLNDLREELNEERSINQELSEEIKDLKKQIKEYEE